MYRLIETKGIRRFWTFYRVYRKSFPARERKPLLLLCRNRRAGFTELLSIEDAEGRFQGLVITVHFRDMVLLDYFAVTPGARGKGIGKNVLEIMQKRYPGKRFFLEYESVNEPCDNMEQRKRRQAFYQRNHMTPMDYEVCVFGTQMVVAGYRCEISFEEYQALYTELFEGRAVGKICKADEAYSENQEVK